jgi:hypothetical protein
MDDFPLRTLVEKAAMDSGFDRAPYRTGALTLFRSTRHPMQIVVDLGNEVLPVIAWLPRSALSLQLLEIAGVTLPGSIIPFPWKGHGIDPQEQQALVVDGVAPIRRLFRAALKESGQTEATATNTTGADGVLTATNAALKQLPIKTDIMAEVLRGLDQERFRDALIDY